MKITENDIELWAIEELENLGWNYMHSSKLGSDLPAEALAQAGSEKPDLQKLATETVLNQAEALAEFWSE